MASRRNRAVFSVFTLLSFSGLIAFAPGDAVTNDEDEVIETEPSLIMTLDAYGGLCESGAECASSFIIDTEGNWATYEGAQGSSEIRDSGNIDSPLISQLMDEVQEIDPEYTESLEPFTGTCPTAYDGQEYIYTFYTDTGVWGVSSCQIDISPIKAVSTFHQIIIEIEKEHNDSLES